MERRYLFFCFINIYQKWNELHLITSHLWSRQKMSTMHLIRHKTNQPLFTVKVRKCRVKKFTKPMIKFEINTNSHKYISQFNFTLVNNVSIWEFLPFFNVAKCSDAHYKPLTWEHISKITIAVTNSKHLTLSLIFFRLVILQLVFRKKLTILKLNETKQGRGFFYLVGSIVQGLSFSNNLNLTQQLITDLIQQYFINSSRILQKLNSLCVCLYLRLSSVNFPWCVYWQLYCS